MLKVNNSFDGKLQSGAYPTTFEFTTKTPAMYVEGARVLLKLEYV
jgi:hypothetical protein